MMTTREKIGLAASLVAIFAFITGYQSVRDLKNAATRLPARADIDSVLGPANAGFRWHFDDMRGIWFQCPASWIMQESDMNGVTQGPSCAGPESDRIRAGTYIRLEEDSMPAKDGLGTHVRVLDVDGREVRGSYSRWGKLTRPATAPQTLDPVGPHYALDINLQGFTFGVSCQMPAEFVARYAETCMAVLSSVTIATLKGKVAPIANGLFSER